MSEGILGLKKYFQERNVFLGANTENKKNIYKECRKGKYEYKETNYFI